MSDDNYEPVKERVAAMSAGELAALTGAAAALSSVVGIEETRFSNLNTRAVAIVSAGGVVTGLLGVFAKDLVGKAITGAPAAPSFLFAGVIALVIAIGTSIGGVLLPSKREFFGNNELTDQPYRLKEPWEVPRIQYIEYREILRSLIDRRKWKTRWLKVSYLSFGVAIFLSAIAILDVFLYGHSVVK